jgi:hypothetical protein
MLILPAVTTGLALLNAHLAFGDKLPVPKRLITNTNKRGSQVLH